MFLIIGSSLSLINKGVSPHAGGLIIHHSACDVSEQATTATVNVHSSEHLICCSQSEENTASCAIGLLVAYCSRFDVWVNSSRKIYLVSCCIGNTPNHRITLTPTSDPQTLLNNGDKQWIGITKRPSLHCVCVIVIG